MASDHGVRADVDVLLIKYRGLREADNAVVAECPETLSTRCVWSNRSMKRKPFPSRMSQTLLKRSRSDRNHDVQSNR